MKAKSHTKIFKKRRAFSAIFVLGVISLVPVFSSSAITYQTTINPTFVINDSLTISLSSSDLVINNLAPGNASDSNIITINVLSNNPNGYTLNSTVGSSTYNNRNLTHTSAASATPFTSLDYGSSIASLNDFSSNQWGYSYSDQTIATPTWSNYSGLPLYTDEEHVSTLKESNTTSAAAGDDIEFKIAAKADTTQLAGEYRNIINFIATGAPTPPSCQSTITGTMQDFDPSVLCEDVTSGTLKDNRDQQDYTITKLADNKWWMTENLNLAGGSALSSANTNVTDAYISSFTTSNNLTKSGNTIVLPASSTSGFNTDNYSYVYNSGNKSSNCASPGCYSYYSWDAATLGSGRNISTDNTNAQQSICPKNWHLPTTYNGTNSSTDFRALMIAYGGSSSVQTYDTSTSPTGAEMYANIGPGSTLNFLLAGYYLNGSFYTGGSGGRYWSATSHSNSNYARSLYFNSTSVYSANIGSRYGGYSVRCVFSQ